MKTRTILTLAMLGAAISFSALRGHAQTDAKTQQQMVDKLSGEMFMRMKTISEAYSNSSARTLGAWGIGSGANFNAEEKQKITPIVKSAPDETSPLNDKIFGLNRDLTAQTGNHKVMLLDYRERLSELRDVQKDLAEAKKDGAGDLASPEQLKVDQAKAVADLFRKGLDTSLGQIGATNRQIQDTEKRRDAIWCQSQGWILSDSADEKTEAKAKNFSCSGGERLVSQIGFGVYTYGCIGSDGYMTHKGNRIIGADNQNTDTNYVRENGGLKVVTTNSEGKLVSERIVNSKEETTKTYGKDGTPATSCSTYGDEKTRNNPYGTMPTGSISR